MRETRGARREARDAEERMAEVEALIEAVKVGDLARIKAIVETTPALVSARLSSGESPVMAALYRGHHQVVALLVGAGADIDIFAAAATGRLDDLGRALRDRSAVHAYAYDGWTPLHLAAFFGQLAAARALLDAGADVHAVSRNALTNTPLHAATAGKHSEVALLLLENGANSDVIDAGNYTPLQIATQNQLLDVVEAIAAKPK
jgi:ankyrin repeat protein